MTHAARFEPPTVKHRGAVAQLRAQVQAHLPSHGEATGTLRCTCGSAFKFTINSRGLSRGRCGAGCGVKWCE